MPRLRLRSLAKVNLDLRVLHKRADGFHELRTVFQTISLADEIRIEIERGGRGIEIDSEIPNNLIVRAAELFLERTGLRVGLRFELKKRIPMGGGLGGGSGNAATVLWALAELTGKEVAVQELAAMGAQLGSDVPFFLLGGTAVGLGRGTELYPLPDLPSLPLVLVTPGVAVSTAEAYGALGRGPQEDAIEQTEFAELTWAMAQGSAAASWKIRNDFEDGVFARHPELREIVERLRRLGARPALMSGSGSTVFGIFAGRKERDRAQAHLARSYGEAQVHAVSTVTRKAYLKMWERQLAKLR